MLFQKVVTVGLRKNDHPNLFKYEICGYPAALFDSRSSMLSADKAALANELWDDKMKSARDPSNPCIYALDGVALVDRIPWTKENTQGRIFQPYFDFITRIFGQAIIILMASVTL